MKRMKTLDSWYKPVVSTENANVNTNQAVEHEEMQIPEAEQNSFVPLETENEQARVLTTAFERDPGKRKQNLELSPAQQDEALLFYISEGPYQPVLTEYPFKGPENHRRRFCRNWFKDFWWLEYSPYNDRGYCLPCFLLSKKPVGKSGSDAFTVKGFQNWKKVNDRRACAFLTHIGQDTGSAHNYSVECYSNLKNRMAHIDRVLDETNDKIVADARLRLATTIDSLR